MRTDTVDKLICLIMLCGSLPAIHAEEPQWGSIKGRVVFDGEVPEKPQATPKLQELLKDAAICAPEPVPDETFVVDPKSKGIANVFVYLRKKPETVHPDLIESSNEPVIFDMKSCRFLPHVLTVQAGQPVRLLNSDFLPHVVMTLPFANDSVSLLVDHRDHAGKAISFKSGERFPFKVACTIHPWMQSWWLVTDHPYVAITNAKGEFQIDRLPVGQHELVAWHERTGYVMIGCKSRRSLQVTVLPGQTTQLAPHSVPKEKLFGESSKP